MGIPVQNIINKAVQNDEEYEMNSWWASKLGQCMRGHFLQRAGFEGEEFDDRLLRVFSVGKQMEDWVVEQLGNEDRYDIETQKHVEYKGVTGKADVIITDLKENEKEVIEIKTQHSKAFTYGDHPKEHHKKQLGLYLKALEIEKGSVLYLSKDDLRIEEYPVYLNDKKLMKSIDNEIDLLNEAWEKKDPSILPLPDENWKKKYCDYHDMCEML